MRFTRVLLSLLILLLGSLVLGQRAATEVVGTGTPASCTEAAFKTAITNVDDGGTVTFNCGDALHTIQLTAVTNITRSVMIDGDHKIILYGGDIDGAGPDGGVRLFLINEDKPDESSPLSAYVQLTLREIILSGANGTSGEGGITGGNGGVIYSKNGIVNAIEVTFINNFAPRGGAVSVIQSGQFNAINSAFISNSASDKGGALMVESIVNVVNSTFANNSAVNGGGIARISGTSDSELYITHSTFSGNTSTAGAQLFNVSTAGNTNGTLALYNNIIVGSGTLCDGRLPEESGGNLVFGDGSCPGVIPISTGDPKLGALTAVRPFYFPIAADSAARDLIDSANCTHHSSPTRPQLNTLFTTGTLITSDQVGTARPQGAKCDAGAVEFTGQVVTPTETTQNPTATNTDVPPTETAQNPTVTPDVTETPIATSTPTSEIPDATPTTDSTPSATETPSGSVNLIGNSGFEEKDLNGKPNLFPWGEKNLSRDKVKCNKPEKTFSYLGDCAFMFKGVPGENAKLQQSVAIDTAVSGSTLNFSLYANSKLPAAGKIGMVKIRYADSKDKISLSLSEPTTDYIPLTDNRVLSGTVTALKVELRNRNPSGKIFIDEVSLTVSSPASLFPLP